MARGARVPNRKESPSHPPHSVGLYSSFSWFKYLCIQKEKEIHMEHDHTSPGCSANSVGADPRIINQAHSRAQNTGIIRSQKPDEYSNQENVEDFHGNTYG